MTPHILGLLSMTSTYSLCAYFQKFMNRTFFYTINGYLGISSSKIRDGDKVCVLRNCPFQVVISESDVHYFHLGSCVVLGLMEGEVAQIVEEQKVSIQTLEIR
jgi:hypothetical protein